MLPELSTGSIPKQRERKFDVSSVNKEEEPKRFVSSVMKKIMDVREHARARSAREQLLNVKEEQRVASEAKSDCEERIRLLMEELQEKQKEQESLEEDMSSSAKKAKYLEEQIKRRDTALSKKTPKSDRGTYN